MSPAEQAPRATARRGVPPLAAYMLHRWDWSETSLILDVFTREAGRLVVAAKGAKRPYSQLRSVLLPFQRLTLGLARAADEAEVQTLRSADWAGGTPLVGGAATLSGLYLNELLMKLLARQDPHPRLFDAYAAALPGLAAADAATTLRAFELVLLREIGLLPQLDQETSTLAALEPGRPYRLDATRGLLPAAGAGVDGARWGRLQAALDDPAGLAPVCQACRGAPAALRTQLQDLLHYHLGGNDLRVRQVLRDARQVLGHPATPDAPHRERRRSS